MTTPLAAMTYLAEHLYRMEGKEAVCYNPLSKPIEELPTIIVTVSGGASNWWNCVAVAEDGKVLGSHICSHEGYAPHDLGVLVGCREDRHEESYSKHYPGGYKMEFVPKRERDTHPLFIKSIKAHKERSK